MANKAKKLRPQNMKKSRPIPTRVGKSKLDMQKAPRGRIVQQKEGK